MNEEKEIEKTFRKTQLESKLDTDELIRRQIDRINLAIYCGRTDTACYLIKFLETTLYPELDSEYMKAIGEINKRAKWKSPNKKEFFNLHLDVYREITKQLTRIGFLFKKEKTFDEEDKGGD